MLSRKGKQILWTGLSIGVSGVAFGSILLRKIKIGLLDMFSDTWSPDQLSAFYKLYSYDYLFEIIIGVIFWIAGVSFARIFVDYQEDKIPKNKESSNTENKPE